MATNNVNFKVKNGLDAGGDIATTGIFKSNNSSGDEGGQIDLAKATTNTTLVTGITLDVYQNKLRIFETGGTNRGYYLDISAAGTSVGSNLATAGGGGLTSVGISLPTGLSVSNSPLTTNGTLAVSFTSGYSIPTTASQTNWDTAYGWGNHASAGYLTAASSSTLTNKTYNGLSLTSAATGFTIAGGTTSKTLTVSGDANISGTSSGTNTGDQTITLTGDVTGTGTGSFATTIKSSVSLTTPVLGVATATSVSATGGFYSSGAFAGTVSDGIILDYVSTNARISAGPSDSITFYNNATTGMGSLTQLATISSTGNFTIAGTGIDGNSTLAAFPSATALTLGYNAGTGANTTNIAVANTAISTTKTINIGTGSQTGAIININMGVSSATATSTINLNGKTVLSGGSLASATSSGAKEYDSTVFYSTPNTTTGRAVDVASYYYVSSGGYGVDFSVNTTAKSIFGAAATGLTLIAGTTYEFELMVWASSTGVGVTTPAYSHSFLLTTVSGSPTTTIYQQIQTGTNTTSFATAQSMTSLINTNNAAVTVLAAAASGVSRYSTYTSKGIIRVTGTGSVEISPAASASTTSVDYAFSAQPGSYIKITPIGNGTVNGVGTWA